MQNECCTMKIYDKQTGLEVKLALTQQQQTWNNNLGKSISNSPTGFQGIIDPPARPEQQPTQASPFDEGMKEWQEKARDIWTQLGQYQKTLVDISNEGKRLSTHVKTIIPQLNTMSKKLFGKDIIDPITPGHWAEFAKQMDEWVAYLQQTQKRILAEGKMDFKEGAKARSSTEEDMIKHLRSKGYQVQEPAKPAENTQSAQPAA